MPLFKGKSKKAFEHNVKAEMDAGKPQKQSLAIAYGVKKKAKKKAAGGSVQSGSPDMNMADGGSIQSKEKLRRMSDKSQKGIHRPFIKNGESELGWMNRGHLAANNEDNSAEVSETAANDIQNVRKEASRIHPKLKGLAEGGSVKPKRPMEAQSNNGRMVKPISKPRMVPSNAFSTRLRDEEDHLESSASPGPYGEEPSQHDNEEGADRQGPESHDLHMKKMALGGALEESPHSEHDEMFHDNEHSQPDDINPAHGMHSMDDSEDQPNHEEHEEHANSIAAAIMSKRARMHEAIDSGARDLDEAVKMAEGGQVDLSESHDEEPNNEDQMSFEALKKENYNSSDLDADQPMDSNEHGDMEEDDSEDKHDKISAMSKKIAMRRQFKVK